MFDLPTSRRVRREELHSPASSPRSTPDPDLEALLRAQIRQDFTFAPAPDALDPADPASDHAPSDDEAELRLFATPANASADAAPSTLRIRLSSPGAEAANPHFIVKKPRSYYFADPASDIQLAQLKASAMDGQAVLDLARQPWPGCAMPWKVTTLTPAGMKKAVLVGHPPALATFTESPPKRTRKNKKTRIALRKKKAANSAKAEERARLAQEKDEAEREKRTRRNREKKVKKKAKAQAAKVATQAGTEAAAGDDATTQTLVAADPDAMQE